MVLDVQILYTEGCANTPQTVQRVRDVARDLGISIDVDKVLVATQDQANELRFLGEPDRPDQRPGHRPGRSHGQQFWLHLKELWGIGYALDRACAGCLAGSC